MGTDKSAGTAEERARRVEQEALGAEQRLRAAQDAFDALERRLKATESDLGVIEQHREEAKKALANLQEDVRYKKLTAHKDRATIFAAIVAVFSVAVAFVAYVREERADRLERTYKLLEAASQQFTDDERFKLYHHFPGRFDYSDAENRPVKPMPSELATRLLAVSKPDSPVYKLAPAQMKAGRSSARKMDAFIADLEAYNSARRHLNSMHTFAFAYVHNTAHRETLAKAICPAMSKSNVYFQPLIASFGKEVGRAQSWQVIVDAVKEMDQRYGTPECSAFLNERPFVDRALGYLGF